VLENGGLITMEKRYAGKRARERAGILPQQMDPPKAGKGGLDG